LRPRIFWDEFFPRDFRHRRQHPVIVNAARSKLFLHHPLALSYQF
jgi:hypothetical protein